MHMQGTGIVYVLFLVWAIFFKCGVPFIGDGTQRIINLLPFQSNTQWELQFNVDIFIPFGFYMSAGKEKWTVAKSIMAIFLMSVALEIAQYVLSIGCSDVTDLLMNTLGGVFGIAIFHVVSKLFGRYARTATLVISLLLTLFVVYMPASFLLLGNYTLGI